MPKSGSGTYLRQLGHFQGPTIVFKGLTVNYGWLKLDVNVLLTTSFRSSRIGIFSLKAVDNAMYSASVVNNATWVCILDAQETAQAA